MKNALLLLLAVLEFSETDLTPLDPHYDGPIIKVSLPLYRCGEIVKSPSGQLSIIHDYRFDGHQWRYQLWKAHYSK